MTLWNEGPREVVTLRPYQSAQKGSTLELWNEKQSVLLVSSVGSGKTTTFCSIVADRIHSGRALILAHRTELVDQAIARLQLFGIDAARDQGFDRAEHHAWASRVIVGTVQTVVARLLNYDPMDFTTVVIDESHHAVASTYQKIVNHFKTNPNCKILGVTGTPDRGDEKALGQVFEAFAQPVYGIAVAVADGWLVNPLQRIVEVEGLDLSRVRTTAGDLNGKDMAEILEDEKILRQIESSVVAEVGDMRTLVFAATVKEAELLSDIFNARTPGCSGWVCGKTPDDVRRKTFREFESGAIQFLINVGIATEGTDMPHVRCVANARMTKSRALYEQISGRALRTVPGIVDGVGTAEARLSAIAASAKPYALLLDFVGNSGKHKLMTVADILGGEISDEVKSLVNARIKKKGKPANVAEEIEAVELEIQKKKERNEAAKIRRQKVIAEARYSTREVNPFGGESFRQSSNSEGPTPNQLYFLQHHGHANAAKYTKRQASAIIGKIKGGGIETQLSDKQKNILIKFNYDIKTMTYEDARREIDAIAQNGWKRPTQSPSFTDRLIHETAEDYGTPAF